MALGVVAEALDPRSCFVGQFWGGEGGPRGKGFWWALMSVDGHWVGIRSGTAQARNRESEAPGRHKDTPPPQPERWTEADTESIVAPEEHECGAWQLRGTNKKRSCDSAVKKKSIIVVTYLSKRNFSAYVLYNTYIVMDDACNAIAFKSLVIVITSRLCSTCIGIHTNDRMWCYRCKRLTCDPTIRILPLVQPRVLISSRAQKLSQSWCTLVSEQTRSVNQMIAFW